MLFQMRYNVLFRQFRLLTAQAGSVPAAIRLIFENCYTTEYLLGSSGAYVVEAQERGGAKAARDIEELVSEVTGLFAGGELSEEAIEGAMKALNDAYWMAKEKNRKYTPKKYRKSADSKV